MGRTPTGKPPGPPPCEIDWNKVDKLLEAGCHGTEIAGYFGIHEDTFYRRVEQEKLMGFSAYSRQKKCRGDSFIRVKQTEVALSGNTTMLIWLGKQRLGQKETQEEAQITPETIAHYKAVLDQMEKLQQLSARKSEETSSNTETKS